MDDIDSLIRCVHANEPGAQDRLFAAAYVDLHQLARSRLRYGGRNTLMDTSVLVHECYLRSIRGAPLRGADRRAFFAYASRVMRSVIIDTVREQRAQRRGGGSEMLPLDTWTENDAPSDADQLLAMNDALDALAQVEPRLAQVVVMRYFGGYSEAEIADALQLTERTVRRDWDKARRLLAALLRP